MVVQADLLEDFLTSGQMELLVERVRTLLLLPLPIIPLQIQLKFLRAPQLLWRYIKMILLTQMVWAAKLYLLFLAVSEHHQNSLQTQMIIVVVELAWVQEMMLFVLLLAMRLLVLLQRSLTTPILEIYLQYSMVLQMEPEHLLLEMTLEHTLLWLSIRRATINSSTLAVQQ